jgi:4-amino-4-deoxy-L-arabinose transferase-like glycosyltransferase
MHQSFPFLAKIRARPWARSLLLAAPALALVVLFTITGFRGVDFGAHWDELNWQIRPVRDMVAKGVLLPRVYNYPSLTKWLALLPAVPAGIVAILKAGKEPPRNLGYIEAGANMPRIQSAIVGVFNDTTYLLAVRQLFIVLSALAIVWVYGAVLALRRPWWEAFVAAAGVGLSWEYAYHARWVTPDCILTMWAALTLFMLALFHRSGRALWLYAAAVAAGLATGTKYQGVILLIPVVVLGGWALPSWRPPVQAPRLVALCAVAFAAYLVTTPATLLDPFAFWQQLLWLSGKYKTGHAGYTVSGAAEHWKVVLLYFSVAFFSPYRIPAMALFLAVVAGAIVVARHDRRLGVVLIGFPLAYLAFFCFSYRVAIVRNYLLVAPFLAVLAARGLAEAFHRLRYRWARWSLAAALGVLMVGQAAWLVRAGETIRRRDPVADVEAAVAYVTAHPRTRFRLSTQVRAMAAQRNLTIPPNATEGPADAVVFLSMTEGPGVWGWKANDPWLTEAAFGPLEVNFSWYSSWRGYDRVVIMTTEKASATGVPLAR